MIAFFKLIRLPNVLMIGFFQVLMRYLIIAPILAVYGLELQLPFPAFLSYVLATMFVAAAGYAVNDYYDVELDKVNRKEGNIIVGNQIQPKKVLWLYRIFNILCLAFAAYSVFVQGIWVLFFCYLFMIGVLYFYTTTYKRQLLLGNLIVAVAAALVPVSVYLFEMPPVIRHYKDFLVAVNLNLHVVMIWIAGFALFAFITTLAREIIKDLEDFEGDRSMGRNTLPVALGVKTAKGVAVSLLAIVILLLGVAYYLFFINNKQPDFVTLVYFFAFLGVPLGYDILHLSKAQTVEEYKFCGDLLKGIMLLGMLYSCIVWFIIHKTFGL